MKRKTGKIAFAALAVVAAAACAAAENGNALLNGAEAKQACADQGGAGETARLEAAPPWRGTAARLEAAPPCGRDGVRTRRRRGRPSGGLLERRSAIPSRPVAVVDAQKTVGADAVARIVADARIAAHLPFALEGGTPRKGSDGGRSAAEDGRTAPLAASVELADVDAAWMTAVFPEDFRARVNVRALAADGADGAVVEERLRKQLIRAALFVLGSGYSPSPCLARPVRNLAELDALDARLLSPETMTHLFAMPKLGVREVRFATYYQAVREGWAPEPTNDIQRAIWEQARADKERGPAKPLVIPPPPAGK